MSKQAELLDLPETEERPKVTICSPKLMILSILSLYFVGQNIYNYLTKPTPVNSPPPVEVDRWEQFWQIYNKFQNYIFVTIIGFCFFIYLRRLNDRHDEEAYLKAKAEAQKLQEQERKIQSEREERIIRKLEEEERAAQERQMRMAEANNQNFRNKDLCKDKQE